MNTHRYDLDEGKIILSSKPLTYAMGASGTVDLKKLTPEDYSQISIIADPQLEELLRIMQNSASALELNSTGDETTAQLNCCILREGEVLIKDGTYKPLQHFLKDASKDELRYVLAQVARQAALLHSEMALAHHERVAV